MFEFKTILEFTKKFGTETQCEKFLIEMSFSEAINKVVCSKK